MLTALRASLTTPSPWSCAGSSASRPMTASSSPGSTTRLGPSPVSSSPAVTLSRSVTQLNVCLSREDAIIEFFEILLLLNKETYLFMFLAKIPGVGVTRR